MPYTFIKLALILFLIPAFLNPLFAQEEEDSHEGHDHGELHEGHLHDIYKLDAKIDGLVLSSGIALNLLGNLMLDKADPATLEEINALSSDDLLFIDRGAVDNYSSNAETISDIILFTSAGLPFLTFLKSNCRREALPIATMGLEVFFITGAITNITKAAVNRYRPFNYNPIVPEEIKLGSNSRRSFFSGHASTTAALSFFAAKVITDSYPDMKNKYIIWTLAATLPATVSYLRHLAGKHFPTDIITGYAVGATIGYFIPKLHMTKDVSITAMAPGGIYLSMKF